MPLQDPLYKSLLKILFREGEYDPRTKNLARRPTQIITEELRSEILEHAGRDGDPISDSVLLSSYIVSFTRRLSKISRPRGKMTKPTTFYDEYCRIFGEDDIFNIKGITEHCQNQALNNEDKSSDPEEHVPFQKRFYLVDCKKCPEGPSRKRLIYKLGTCISTCAWFLFPSNKVSILK
jgi:hypothetical protein